jgi:ribosomal protein RSM22 (predicted rRNA methylase)
MSYDLPAELFSAVAEALGDGGAAPLRAGVESLSRHYRAGGTSGAAIDLRAYLATRLPATFAAVRRVLEELRLGLPDFRPASLLDAGSGPGTAGWAAAGLWPELAAVTFLDNNRNFLDLAARLAAASPAPALAGARAVTGDFARGDGPEADLVIAAYAFAELPEQGAAGAALSLWRKAKAALVIVEPGTPQGFARVLKARKALVESGAWLLAPCPHADLCPLPQGDWCHFAVRLPRRRLHLQAKAARVPFEDEKFAYVIASRQAPAAGEARILAPPRQGKAAIRLKLCTAHGLTEAAIARRDRDAYKRAKNVAWGDVW